MRRLALSVFILAVSALPGLAFEPGIQAVLDRAKSGKLVHIGDVAVLMMGAERWCYNQRETDCAWSDIYLSVEGSEATYEISNPWSEDIDISFVDRGVLRDNRYVCEMGYDWVPSVRAYGRESGKAIEGRELEALRQEIRNVINPSDSSDCFDYLYQGADAASQVVTLLQRQYSDGVTNPANDAVVTLHFDKAVADDLGWYW